LNLFNEKNTQNIFISLDNKNNLVIGEKNNVKIKILSSYPNINNYLLTDNNFHNISIIIDTENKIIKILIDYKKINFDEKLIHYTYFSFENISLFIGYEYDLVNDFINKNSENNAPIIDIANFLMINYENDSDNFLINRQEQNLKNETNIDYVTEYILGQKQDNYSQIIFSNISFNLSTF
jgi:hypothetical protein